MLERFLNLKNLYSLLGVEPFLIISALVFLSWFFYRFFLSDLSAERHKGLKDNYKNIFRNYFLFTAFFASFHFLFNSQESATQLRMTPYLGLVAYFFGLIVFVKVAGISILQYLFLGSMKHGVPLLVVNIGTLILSLFLAILTANYIFEIQIVPLLATSAALSVILGLALQDTLGNLFAGISLQFDRTFEIGDWIEVRGVGQNTVGCVKEISWRATVLLGWTDEVITIPNRILAGTQIANFHSGERPFFRSQIFRLSYDVDVEKAKTLILKSIQGISGIRPSPAPLVCISESTDSWLSLKLNYSINDYGNQYAIGDLILFQCLRELHSEGIKTVGSRIAVNIQQ